ncbi:hypothetical protein SAPIO_CDS9465 [Scedosporium apiospermum]|uniref:S-adenosyl-L-methionine-dependent methyltransferase n=1 Tax=Pseudallescheria apiosperma TaxID=563466 RepID=A0A084FWV1_PSEDA|nr:uncharacterized protein SAPIO_CDS9465 [Scedosporium apiospermum]KEZ39563.1 hypothetical protein SAPIO_CDS9465 [Scedosporium apiospermum]
MTDAQPPKSPKAGKTPSPQPPSSPISPRLGNIDAPIEADTADADSVYASSVVTDTTSLRSSILAYKWEHGRRYHAYQDGAYWGPNDEKQQEAEDLSHEMFKIILNGLTLAPISDDVQNVLDVGCGTGAWAIEFADAHPSSQVIGVDLSPIQPSFVPPNCKFEVDDVIKDFTYPDNYFDYIHIRSMTGCIPDWVQFHRKALKHLKPGGWTEHIENSGVVRSDDGTLGPAMAQWWGIFDKIGKATGKTFGIAETLPDVLKEAGYTNIVERRIKIPIGTWPKNPDLKHWGAWNRQFILQGVEGFSIRGLTDCLGWTYEEAQLYLVSLRKELTDPKIHAYLELAFYAGQKPEAAEESTAA